MTLKVWDKVTLKSGKYTESPDNPIWVTGTIVKTEWFIRVDWGNWENNSYSDNDLTIKQSKTKIKVRWKVKETTDEEDNITPDGWDSQRDMSPQDMADILDKAMKVIEDNWLADQLKDANSAEENQQPEGWWQPPQQDPGWWWGGDEKRKVYVLGSDIDSRGPIVAENYRQALDHSGYPSCGVKHIFVEQYTEPTDQQKQTWINHDWLVPPFYY